MVMRTFPASRVWNRTCVRLLVYFLKINFLTLLLSIVPPWSCNVLYAEGPLSHTKNIYLNSLQAATLYGTTVEFYEAYLVTNTADIDDLLTGLNLLCKQFPKLASYTVRIFSRAKYADSISFRKYYSDYPLIMKPIEHMAAQAFVAEYTPNTKEITFFPVLDKRKFSQSIDLCK